MPDQKPKQKIKMLTQNTSEFYKKIKVVIKNGIVELRPDISLDELEMLIKYLSEKGINCNIDQNIMLLHND